MDTGCFRTDCPIIPYGLDHRIFPHRFHHIQRRFPYIIDVNHVRPQPVYDLPQSPDILFIDKKFMVYPRCETELIWVIYFISRQLHRKRFIKSQQKYLMTLLPKVRLLPVCLNLRSALDG